MTLPISTAELVKRFQDGETMSYLASQYGCSEGTILYRLNQAGARSRTRAKLNARVLLKTHKPVLEKLLRQLRKTLTAVREEFVSKSVTLNRDGRKKYIDRIETLQDQIHALESLTRRDN
jgi:hypothetical protein